MVKGLRPDDMAVVTMCGMVGIGYHVGLIALDDSTQVALALAYMGGNLKATIEYLKAKIALAGLVCYNELHMFFVFVWLKLGNDWFCATLKFVDLNQASSGIIGSP